MEDRKIQTEGTRLVTKGEPVLPVDRTRKIVPTEKPTADDLNKNRRAFVNENAKRFGVRQG